MMQTIALLFHDVYTRDPAESGFVSDAADRYKLTVPDFDAQLAGVRDVRSDSPIVAAALPRHAADPVAAARGPFLITVDDGGASYYTHIAERLEHRGWRGHCFVTTDFIDQRGFMSRDELRSLDKRGHVIGSHSASHPARFSALPFDRMVSEWSRSCRLLEDILGRRIEIASVPGGYFSPDVARAAHEAGIRVLFTSEPVTRIDAENDCLLVGRFTIRRGDPRDRARRLVSAAPWTRALEWASWNAKGIAKPLLGPSYVRIADWLLTARPSSRAS
jgi:peptidoglycan/xylan/chitin deacetylase (PgdA/CDA1 family)